MKIAFIGQKGIPVTFGGVEYQVDELSKGMAKLGHEVHAYVRNWYTRRNLKNYEGVRLIHVPTIKSKHLDASIHSFLSTLVAIFKNYDVIHYHAIGPTFFSIIPRLCGDKIVSTVHRLDWETEKWRKGAKLFLKCGEYISARTPHQTIVVSDTLRQYFKNKYFKNTILIQHGINMPQKRPAKLIDKKYNLKERSYILFMGRLTPEKRVDWLIKAYQDLRRLSQLRDIKLVVAGGSSATDDYMYRLKKMSSNSQEIIFPGYVKGIEKEELLSNAFLFALPSYLEGFPIVLIEAKSYGICCLVSDISPHREAIKQDVTGVLFKSDTFSDLKQKLHRLINDPRKAEMIGKRAREEMEKRPKWDVVVKKTLEIYQKVLESNQKS